VHAALYEKKPAVASMLTGPHLELSRRLAPLIPPERIIHDDLRLLAEGADASFYRLVPKVIVHLETEQEVCLLLREASALGTPVTFRAAGTSLSGQAVTDSVLAHVGHGWRRLSVEADGARIRLQPGVVGSFANLALARLGRKIGPDPASINAAMIGGIAANNASGMCCGTAQNSYNTLHSMRVILADGTLLDTGDPDSRAAFISRRPELAAGLASMARRVKADEPLAARIRRKFAMKNTTGYSLNALVDFDDPVDVLQHLMIGSEGTLGFIAEITYRTVPEYADKATCLMLFPDVETACRAVPLLKSSPVDAVELMDRASLRSVERKPGMPAYLSGLPAEAASLLVETRAPDPQTLAAQIQTVTRAVAGIPLLRPLEFTSAAADTAVLWNIRKGLFPSVGAMRKTGTTVIIEDVAFPVPRLAEATADLQRLFRESGYTDAIIFGHALEGNLHIVFKQDFNAPPEVERYRRFMDALTALVVRKYDGSLKAEHGTGRNIAPFVEMEWGRDAYALMREIKALFDPGGVLNPGVVLNDDPKAHLRNLKPLPAAHEIVDTCIECGFCEVHCPSRDLTLTPRQRIVVFREAARLRAEGSNPVRLAALERGYAYQGEATCATDGLCSLACPVSIDTGKLVKHLRHATTGPTSRSMASLAADSMALVTGAARFGLSAVGAVQRLIGDAEMEALGAAGRLLTGGLLPSWNRAMPGAAPALPTPKRAGPTAPRAVYFPTCINRTLGPAVRDAGGEAVPVTTVRLLEKAGFEVVYPPGVESLCCGMAFASKGFREAGDRKSRELFAALLDASEGGALPILIDMSPCTQRMREEFGARLPFMEPVAFAREHLLPRLRVRRQKPSVAVHVTCSGRKMGLEGPTRELAGLLAEEVIAPESVECCGWAGDRGFLVPELTASALQSLKPSLPAGCREGYSTSRTCEIGLTLHGGIPYRSIFALIDECTEAR
jgi:D-lactate dehydrogenase